MGSSHPLDGAERRFNRAYRHLAEADDLIRAFSKTCENNIFSRDNYKTINFGKWPPVPDDLPLVVSDAIHNLRAALDYIIYELAILDSGKVQDGTQFLIEDVKVDPANPKRGFDARSKQCLKRLNQRHVDAIERLQPYMGVEWTRTLRDISNPDKHRKLIVLTHEGRQAGVTIQYSSTGKFPGALKMTPEGPVFDRYDVDFDAHQAIAIATGDPCEPPLMNTLRRVQAEVCSTIELFKPEFKA